MTKILVAGDYCPMGGVSAMLLKNDYSFFDDVKSLIQQAHYSVVNFETTIANERETLPITKNGASFCTTPHAIDALRYAGFDCVTLANNHFRDYGDAGCKATIAALKSRGIDYVGGGANIDEAQQILYKEIDGQKIAFVNFCENEFSIASHTRAGAAPLDAVDNYNQIVEARRNAQYVVVIVHGGHEYYELPSVRMKKLYRHFVTIGADAVVNHHQHCYSGYEYYKGKPIVYGLGNLLFDRKGKPQSWHEGYFAMIHIDANGVSVELHPYRQCVAGTVAVQPLAPEAQERVLAHIDELNRLIASDELLQEKFDRWCEEKKNDIHTVFNSHHNRYLNAAARRGWIGWPISLNEQSLLLNFIVCEANRDVALNVLFKEIEKNR